MKRVILESPYAGDTERNKLYLRKCTVDCLRRGEAPFASHRMYTDALDDLVPEERKLGIEAGFAWRAVAEMTVFYVDYGWSTGMNYGLEHCKKHDLPYEERRIL